jgi:rubredoxin
MVERSKMGEASVGSVCSLCGGTDLHQDNPAYAYCRDCGLVSALPATVQAHFVGMPTSDPRGTDRWAAEGGRAP